MGNNELVRKLDSEVRSFFSQWISPTRLNRELRSISLPHDKFMAEWQSGTTKSKHSNATAFLAAFYDSEKETLFFRSDATLGQDSALVAHELIHSYTTRYRIGTWALEEAFTQYLTDAFCEKHRYSMGTLTCYGLHSLPLDDALKGKPKDKALEAIALFHFRQETRPLLELAGQDIGQVLKTVQAAITKNCALR